MESYWYLTKGVLKPKNRGCVSVLVRNRYSLIELTNEADKSAIEKYQLAFLGYGELNDKNIQGELLRKMK